MARMDPLPADARPELAATFATFERILGVVPNSLLTMQRRPRIGAAFEALTEAVRDPDGVADTASSVSPRTWPVAPLGVSTVRPTPWSRPA